LRVTSSSTEAKGLSARAAIIFCAVTGPTPGSVSSSAAVAVLRSIRPDPPPRPPLAPATPLPAAAP
jgi:hypothetical protein